MLGCGHPFHVCGMGPPLLSIWCMCRGHALHVVCIVVAGVARGVVVMVFACMVWCCSCHWCTVCVTVVVFICVVVVGVACQVAVTGAIVAPYAL